MLRISGSIVLDNQIAKEILDTYDEISYIHEIDGWGFLITLFGKQFLLIPPKENVPASRASIFLYNDSGLDIPHIMLREELSNGDYNLPEGTYRFVCLYEQESVVNSIVSYEEKIADALDRLIELLTMEEIEKEREFQKEFLFYWNNSAISPTEYLVYLKSEQSFLEMDMYFGNGKFRLIDRSLTLSDIDCREKGKREWEHHIEADVFYIPIIDSRGILPPHRGYSWTEGDIRNIVYAPQIEHVSSQTFQELSSIVPKTQDIILVFGLQSERVNCVFSAKIKCKNKRGLSLLEKIKEGVVSVEPLRTSRKDYLYLNEQIGNDIGLLNKKVTLIGAGSLGSYVAFELVKNGVASLKIYDGDSLQDENILRWAYGGIGKGSNKATTLSLLLNLLHPEICVEPINNNIDEKELEKEILLADLLVVTVGSSDEQLKFNRILKSLNCSIPVFFVWLEDGGIYSHILIAEYKDAGCFECLYTSKDGQPVNNRARKNPDNGMDGTIIRNGCGGTRAAYGTAILLRTVAALLDSIHKVMTSQITKSTLIDISDSTVCISNTKFPEEECNCCGNRKKQ